MNAQKSFRQIVLAVAACTFLAISFSSCYRGHGCPGQITHQPAKAPVEATTDGNC